MSELSKQALRVENNTQFPNNNSGYITPSRLRGFNSDMIDSTVNQNQYNIDSGSWNNKINSLEAFTGSIDNNFVSETEFAAYTSSNNTKVNNLTASSSLQQSEIDALIAFTGSVSSIATGSLLVTASATLNVITFTKGDASTFNVTVGADTTALNAFTASQETKDATLASYTGSNDTKWNTLGSQSGSWVTETESGSFLVTASFATQTLTFTKGNGTTFSVFIPDNSGSIVNLTPLNDFTASQNTKNATLATYTGSVNQQLTSLASATASLLTETQNLELFTSSQNTKNATLATYTGSNDTKWSTLGSQSGSWVTETESGSFLITASVTSNIITFTKGNNTQFSLTVGADTTALNAFTASQQLLNTTFATTGSNVFVGNQSLSGSILISGSTLNVTSGSANGNVITNLGDTYTDTNPVQTIVSITSASYAALVSSSTYNPNTLYIISGAVDAPTVDLSSLNAFTASQDSKNATLASVTASLLTETSNLELFTASQQTKNNTLASYTSSNDTKWSNLGSQSGSWITESETSSFARTNTINNFTETQNFTNVTVSGTASVAFLQVTYESSSVIYSSGSNQFGDAADDVQTLYGSVRVMNQLTASGLNYPTADNGAKSFIQTDGNGNLSLQYVDTIFETIYAGASVPKGTPLYISGSQGANPKVFPADASDPNKMPVTYIAGEAYTINNTYPATVLGLIEGIDLTGYTVGQTVYVAEGGGWTTNLPSGSNSITQVLGVVTKAGNGGKGLVLNPGPAQLPGLQTGYVWVGNGVNQPIAVTTSSLVTTPTDISALNAFTASQEELNLTFATTGSNTFRGVQNIVSASFSGSLISNLTDIYTDIPAVDKIVTLTSASYAALVTGSLTDDNTLYIVSSSVEPQIDLGPLNAFTASQEELNLTFATTGSNEFQANQIITGSLILASVGDPEGYAVTIAADDSISRLTIGAAIRPAGGVEIPDGEQITFIDAVDSTLNTKLGQIDGVGLRIFNAAAETGSTLELFKYNLNLTDATFTASITEGYVWVGNDLGKTYEVATSSFGGGGTDISALNAFTASQEALNLTFATTGSNEFQANQIITGSLRLASVGDPEGYGVTITADDSITRLTIGATVRPGGGLEVPDGEQITFLDAVDADWNTKLGQTDQLGLRIFTTGNVSGSTLTLDNYNLVVSGSARGRVDELSIASTTASIDLSKGNYFTLQLAASATTHITATNIQPGQTITLLLSTNTNSSVVLAPNILEPSGSFYTASASGSKDILSLVAFDSTTLYAVSTKNMI